MFGLSAFAQAPFASLGQQLSPDTTVNVATTIGIGSVGSVVVSAGANIHEFITGVVGVAHLDDITFSGTTTQILTGQQVIGSLGNLANTAGAVVPVTNTVGVTGLGDAVVFGGSVQGVSSSGKTLALGEETIIGTCNVLPTGVTTTVFLGTISLSTQNLSLIHI